jgi:hypothetical protein
MSDFAFKPAGAAFAAIVAGIAPGADQAEANEAAAALPAEDASVSGAMVVEYGALPAAEPLGASDALADLDAANADVPLSPGAQLRLPRA